MRYSLFSLFLVLAVSIGHAQVNFGNIRQLEDTLSNSPWTTLEFNDSPDQFQFAIVTDRTGGHRPGVFLDGVRKLNLLQPEFVMSVGDLIEGYTQDTVELNRQWREFNGFVEQLDMPFFYVPGNHDITNKVMEELWIKQFKTTFYHFTYQDVLFLCLNSEDRIRGAGRGTIANAQYEYIKKTLAEHPDVRWTLVFMHQPLWDQEEETLRWPDVETLLEGRPHTVFAGHRHRYVSYERNENKYIMLATTGGGSSLRGPEFGEFDHVVWITMTQEGPVIANLWLDGILDADLMTEKGREFVEGLGDGYPVRPSPIFWIEEKPFEAGLTRIKLSNTRDIPMKVALQNPFSWDFTSNLKADTITVAPNSVAFTEMGLAAKGGETEVDKTAKLGVHIGYEVEGLPKVMVPMTFNVGPIKAFQLEKMAQPIQIDGDLSEWKTFPHKIDTDNPEDCSGQFQVSLGDDHLYFAVQVKDDNIQSDTGTVAWQQDYISLIINGDPLEISALRSGSGWYNNSLILNTSPAHGNMPASIFYEDRYEEGFIDWSCIASEEGYVLEAAIPLSYIVERQGEAWRSARINVALQDRDENEQERPRFSWQPSWRGENNIVGSGMFFKAPLQEVQEIKNASPTGER